MVAQPTARIEFKRATREQAKARIALQGPSGSGKTFTALAIATGLAGEGGRIAVIDSEHGSASKYANLFEFDTLCLSDLGEYDPRLYVQAIEAAEQAGYDVVVIDSLSHAWDGAGGVLEQVDKAAARNRGNTWAAWSEGTPLHRRLIEAITGCSAHVVATMRVKTAWETVQNGGKSTPQKIGLAPVQRDGMDYEFDVVAELDLQHRMLVTKTRYSELDNKQFDLPGVRVGETIRETLTQGVPPAPRMAPPDPAAPTAAPAPAPKPITYSALLKEAVERTTERTGAPVASLQTICKALMDEYGIESFGKMDDACFAAIVAKFDALETDPFGDAPPDVPEPEPDGTPDSAAPEAVELFPAGGMTPPTKWREVCDEHGIGLDGQSALQVKVFGTLRPPESPDEMAALIAATLEEIV